MNSAGEFEMTTMLGAVWSMTFYTPSKSETPSMVGGISGGKRGLLDVLLDVQGIVASLSSCINRGPLEVGASFQSIFQVFQFRIWTKIG